MSQSIKELEERIEVLEATLDELLSLYNDHNHAVDESGKFTYLTTYTASPRSNHIP